MRFVVEVCHDPAGRIHGTVTPEGRPCSDFSGWLELVRLLEGRASKEASEKGEHT